MDQRSIRAFLTFQLFLHILRFLATPSSLSRVALVSRSWNKAANDSALWTEMTRQLWDGKVYIPDKFREMLNDDPKGAYRDSWKDSKRDVITAEELCSFEWQWRFKEAAGEHFTEEDPWWAGEAPRRRIYKPDGTMGGHSGLKWAIARSLVHHSDEFMSFFTVYRPDARWRFVNNAQGKLGELGRFVRVANTPASVFSRHSWVLECCWIVLWYFGSDAKFLPTETGVGLWNPAGPSRRPSRCPPRAPTPSSKTMRSKWTQTV